MADSINKILKKIQDLIIKGSYNEAVSLIESTLLKEDIDQFDFLTFQHLKARTLFELGKYAESLELIKEFEINPTIVKSKTIIFEYKYLKANCFAHTGNFQEALDVVKELEAQEMLVDDKETMEYKRNEIRILKIIGVCQRALGNPELSEKTLLKGLELSRSIENNFEISEFLDRLAMLISAHGRSEDAITLLRQSLHIRREIGNDYFTGQTLNRIGIVLSSLEDTVGSLESYQEAYNLTEKYENKDFLAILNANIANIHSSSGKINLALDFLSRSLKFSKETNNRSMIALAHHNISGIYRQRGELDKALEFEKEALKYFTELGYKSAIASASLNLGQISVTLGEHERAIEYFENSRALRNELNQKPGEAASLFYLIKLSLDMNLLNKANDYFEELESIAKEDEEHKQSQQRLKIAEALILMTSSRFQNRAKAEALLREVNEGDVLNHELTVDSLLITCDLLLSELRIMGNKEVLNELKDLTNRLIELAKAQHSSLLLAQTYWLQSQLFLIELNIGRAKELLIQAQLIAEEKNLNRLVLKISQEYDKLLNQAKQWANLIEKDAGVEDIMAMVNVDDLLLKMTRRSAIEDIEHEQENPVFLIILSKDGKTIFSRKFETLTRLDDALIGGFVAAINSFASELFETSGHIERIKHQDYTLLIKIQENFLFTYVFRGQSLTALSKLSQYAEAVSAVKYLWESLVETSKTPGNIEENLKFELERKADSIFIN
jgi:tetratricopeptide (TPR) repeat protein